MKKTDSIKFLIVLYSQDFNSLFFIEDYKIEDYWTDFRPKNRTTFLK